MQATTIYGLVDPRDGIIRYVGKTKQSVQKRLVQHICDARNRAENNYRSNWIRHLLTLSLKPSIVILEECDHDRWVEREMYWIAFYQDMGQNLVNATNGGEGVDGYIFPEERKKEYSNRMRGRRLSEKTKSLISQSNKGKEVSSETREKLRIINKGKVMELESREKTSITLGRCQTGIRGISITKYGKYKVRCGCNGQRVYLGCFETLKEAKEARDSVEHLIAIEQMASPEIQSIINATFKNRPHRGISNREGKYIVRMTLNKKRIRVGTFSTMADAIHAKENWKRDNI